MVKVTLITVGTLKEDYLVRAAAEYEKRLGAFCAFSSVNIKEEKILSEESEAAIKSALLSEGERILAKIPQNSYRIALAVEGDMLSSEQLAEKISEASDSCGNICLIIGSSHGLADEVKNTCRLKLSLSMLTFPHQLARVITMEALYRSFSISAGRKYHK